MKARSDVLDLRLRQSALTLAATSWIGVCGDVVGCRRWLMEMGDKATAAIAVVEFLHELLPMPSQADGLSDKNKGSVAEEMRAGGGLGRARR